MKTKEQSEITNSNKTIKPLKVGEKVWLEVISKGKNGDGVASFGNSNFIVIIPNTEIGKEYKIQILKVTRNVAFGEVIRNCKRQNGNK